MSEWLALTAVYIALFLSGMTVMRHGLMMRVTRSLSHILHTFVDKPWKGLLIGTAASAIIQSSSAVMVITVALVAAKMITFRNSVGIILGANIGTVTTLEILAFDLEAAAIPLLLTGILLLFSRRENIFSAGCLLFGFGMMITAMNGFESLADLFSSVPAVHSWFYKADTHLWTGVFSGVFLSSIIQSSSAVTAMTMTFINENSLTLPASIAIMLGANIGTCVTALLASIGSSKEAKLTAYAHVWINIAGVLLFLPFLDLFSELVTYTAYSPARQLAHAAFIFNAATSFLLLPFAGPLAHVVERIHSRKNSAFG